MVPQQFRFGGGAGETALLPLVALYLLIVIVLIITLPRAKAVVPFLAAYFTIPVAQVVVLGGVHFTALRILTLAGLARTASFRGSSSRSKYPGGFNSVDRLVVLWSVSTLVAFCLQFVDMQAWINGLGVLLDILGGYLVVRSLIPDGAAMRRAIETLAVICAIQGVCMINEKVNSFNVFGYLGAGFWVAVRDGHIRAAGSLGALTAGPFAGVLIPLFFWLSTERKSRVAGLAGLAGATAMVITSNSSTSWMALGGGLLGLAFWPFRKQMRLIRWGLVCMLVGLHMVMKAPVWALISRIDLTGSSSSYQRFVLVDMTIKHFSDWWLMGTPSYINWGWDSYDLCNQFVAVALTGGLLTLIFYIWIFKLSFADIGNARKRMNGNRRKEWLFWCLGSTLFAIVVTHFGINYMIPLIMSLFIPVACIRVAAFEAKPATIRVEAPIEDQAELACNTQEPRLPLAGWV